MSDAGGDIEELDQLVYLHCPLAVRRFSWRQRAQKHSASHSTYKRYSSKCHDLCVLSIANELVNSVRFDSTQNSEVCCCHKTRVVDVLRDICSAIIVEEGSSKYLILSRSHPCNCSDESQVRGTDILHVQQCSNHGSFLVSPIVVSENWEKEYLDRQRASLRAGAKTLDEVLNTIQLLTALEVSASTYSEFWIPDSPFQDVVQWLFRPPKERKCYIPWLSTSMKRKPSFGDNSSTLNVITFVRKFLLFRGAGDWYYDLARKACDEMVADAKAECEAHQSTPSDASPDLEGSQKESHESKVEWSFPERILDSVSNDWFFQKRCVECPFLFDCKQSALRDELPQCVGTMDPYKWYSLNMELEPLHDSATLPATRNDPGVGSQSAPLMKGADVETEGFQDHFIHSFRTAALREGRILSRNVPLSMRTDRIPNTTLPLISLVVAPPHVNCAEIEGIGAGVPRLVLGYTTPRGMKEFLFDDDAVKVALSSGALSAAIVVWDEQQKRAAQVELLQHARKTNQLHKLTGVFETLFNVTFDAEGESSSRMAITNEGQGDLPSPILHPLVDRIYALSPLASQCLSLTVPQPYAAAEVLSRARQINVDTLVGNSAYFADFILDGIRKKKTAHETVDENDIPERLMAIAKILIERMELIRNAQNEQEPVVRHKPPRSSTSTSYFPSFFSSSSSSSFSPTAMLCEFLGRLSYISQCHALLKKSHTWTYRCSNPFFCKPRHVAPLKPDDSLWLTAVEVPFLHDPFDGPVFDDSLDLLRQQIVDVENVSMFPDIPVKYLFDSRVNAQDDEDVVDFVWVEDDVLDMSVAVILQLRSTNEAVARATTRLRVRMTKSWRDGARWSFQPKLNTARDQCAVTTPPDVKPSLPQEGRMAVVGVRFGGAVELDGKVHSHIFVIDASWCCKTGPLPADDCGAAEERTKDISYVMARSDAASSWKCLQLAHLRCSTKGKEVASPSQVIIQLVAEHETSTDCSPLGRNSIDENSSLSAALNVGRSLCEIALYSGSCCGAVQHLASLLMVRFRKCTTDQLVAIAAPSSTENLRHFCGALQQTLESLQSEADDCSVFTCDVHVCSCEEDVLLVSETSGGDLTDKRHLLHHRVIIGLVQHLCTLHKAFQTGPAVPTHPDWSALPLAGACDVLIMLDAHQLTVTEGALCERLLKSEDHTQSYKDNDSIQLLVAGDRHAEQIDACADEKDLAAPLSAEESRVLRKYAHASKSLLFALLSCRSVPVSVVSTPPSPFLSDAERAASTTRMFVGSVDAPLSRPPNFVQQVEITVTEVASPFHEVLEICRVCANKNSRVLVVCHSYKRSLELFGELCKQGLSPRFPEHVDLNDNESPCVHITTAQSTRRCSDDLSHLTASNDAPFPLKREYDSVVYSLANEGCFYDLEVIRLTTVSAAVSLCRTYFLLLVCAYTKVRDACAFSLSWADEDSQDGVAYVYQLCKASSSL